MLFLCIFKHSPESCPIHNEKAEKATTDLMENFDELSKKHGIKIVGEWLSMSSHMAVGVYDAPNMEAMMKFSMEPVIMNWMAYNHTEMLPVSTLEESKKLLQ